MENFKILETTNIYDCFKVSSKILVNDERKYLEKKTIIFDNEEDAKKCLYILGVYNDTFRMNIVNTIKKDMFVFDGVTIHMFSGEKINYFENEVNMNKIREIEGKYVVDSWEYMDEYVKLFNYRVLRPRSFWTAILLFSCCSCFCCVDPFKYAM